jgi:hypothetical protein
VETQKVAVVNDPGYFRKYLRSDTASILFSFEAGVDSGNYLQKGYDGILYLPKDGEGTEYQLLSKKQLGIASKKYLERQLSKARENRMLENQGIDKAMLDSISEASDRSVMVSNKVTGTEGKSKQANAGLAYGIGFGSGLPK